MKQVKHLFTMLLLLAGLTGVISSCKKPEPEPTQPATPTINNINPPTATAGSSVTITGTNFNSATTGTTGTTVTIGGVPATVVSASGTQIVVVVPSGTTGGTVSVTTSGTTVQGTTAFTVATKPTKSVSGNIAANTRWSKDTIYLVRGMVYVLADYTLTVDAGTIIKGAGPDQDPSGKSMPGTLVIERRGKIIAQGTAAQPIVFTSSKASGQRNYGDWGGVVLIGKSPINRAGTTALPAGVRGTVETYGEPADNSGVLQYVRIEYAGALQPGAATKLGGLSLYGVGSGTTIDHVQVSYSGNDAFALFGGSANLKNLFAYRTYDDNWSVDWGFVGNVQFGVSLRDPDVADQSGSNGIELENYEPTLTSDVSSVTITNGLTKNVPVFANISDFAFSAAPTTTNPSKGTGPFRAGLYLRRNSAIAVYNSVFYGYPEGLRMDATSTSGLNNLIDLKGVVLANNSTAIVATGGATVAPITAYFTDKARSNQVVAIADAASLLLNDANFTLAGPIFTLKSTSPLLGGSVTGSPITGSFFTTAAYRGAFGADNWLTGWVNYGPQSADYDR